MIDLKEFIKKIDKSNDKCPITKKFAKECESLTEKTGQQWITNLDKGTFEIISNMVYKIENGKEDVVLDDEVFDFLALCMVIACFENVLVPDKISDQMHEDTVVNVATFVHIENLRRLNFVTVCGNGKLSDVSSDNTITVNLSKNAKTIVGGAVDTLEQIATAMSVDRE